MRSAIVQAITQGITSVAPRLAVFALIILGVAIAKACHLIPNLPTP